jgi:acyl-CoA reductase-like NAD-dependent aldehyde dehydrogenase
MFELKNGPALFIDGAWERTSDLDDIVNPATEEVIIRSPLGRPADAEAAIAAARHAFEKGPWPAMKPSDRQATLQRFLDVIRSRRDEIIRLIIAEAGSTVALAHTLQYNMPLKVAQYMVDHCDKDMGWGLKPELSTAPNGRGVVGTGVVVREPIGVVVAITPYNVPFFLNVAKIVPAMAVGCTVVLKPSPYTPTLALILGEIAQEAGIPAGVLNIITGDKDVGEILTTDPRVDMVTFTGSDVVGEAIQRQTAGTLKRVVLELGGKSALIIRHDADLDLAARAGVRGFTAHAGQGCQLLTRHIVHNSIRAAYVEKVREFARELTLGDPADAATHIGPLIREVARQRTEEYVAIAQGEGARLVLGGKRPAHLQRGYFHEPTLFDDVQNDSRLAQEEVFGPIGAVIGFDDDDEAIALANDSRFGLTGCIHSADAGKAYELALRMRTGGVSINEGPGAMLSSAPFGGIRRSGYGREFGIEGMHEFTYTKTVTFRAA